MQDMDLQIFSLHKEKRFPHFPGEEFELRLKKAKDSMSKYGIDALLLFSPEDLYYYTGFKKENYFIDQTCRRGAIIPREGDPVLLVGNDAFFNAITTSWPKDIRKWGGEPEFGRPENFMGAFTKIIKEMDLFRKTLGIELWEKVPAIEVDLTWMEFDDLKRCLREAKIVDAGELIWEQRMVKTPYEIGIIKELASIVVKGFKAGLEAIREGTTEREIINVIYRTVISEGTVWNQPMWGRIPIRGPGHYHAGIMGPQKTILKKGDMLMFDGGPCHKGYWSDIQRNACIGEPPPLQRQLYDASLEGLDAALSVIRPGIRAGDIYRAASERMGKMDSRFSVIRNVFAGHGLGLHTHEPPYLDPRGNQADIEIKEGMYLAVEISALDIPEFKVIGGFPEDNILVTKDGYENLTKDIPRHLWIA